MIYLFGLILINYLAGSIPFAYIVVKFVLDMDIRTFGSGNVGATNVTRAAGLKYGVLVFFLDFLKGLLPTFLTFNIYGNYISETIDNNFIPYFLILFILTGHIFPVFLKFKGGKGAATGIGIVSALTPIAAVSVFILWVIIYYTTKYVSLASILAGLFLPVFVWFFSFTEELFIFSLIASFFVVIKHRSNIVRLIKGEEHKFTKNKN
ncbi:MAG: glycerol-3-phosphate 1-O-acyltransferase PlsY [Candidatus Muiribacteriota bacterium]